MNNVLNNTIQSLINSGERARVHLVDGSDYTGIFSCVEESGEVVFNSRVFESDKTYKKNMLGEEIAKDKWVNVAVAIPVNMIVCIIDKRYYESKKE